MDDIVLRFCIFFKSISVISGRLADDNERLCARRGGCLVAYNTLDYQLRDHKINPLLLRLLEETVTKVPSPYQLIVGETLTLSSLTHCFCCRECTKVIALPVNVA